MVVDSDDTTGPHVRRERRRSSCTAIISPVGIVADTTMAVAADDTGRGHDPRKGIEARVRRS